MKTIESDIDYCKKAILHGSLSFHAASLALPESVRTPCLALYAFCRLADDEVDLKQDKSASIYDLVQRLDLVYAGTPRNHPMDRAFASMVEKFDMPRALPEALFEGFVWDAMSKQYNNIDVMENKEAMGNAWFVRSLKYYKNIDNLILQLGLLRFNHKELKNQNKFITNSIRLVSSANVPLPNVASTTFNIFKSYIGARRHIAIIIKPKNLKQPTNLRIHSACFTGDIFHSRKCDCGEQLNNSLNYMVKNKGGIILYLDQEGRGIGLANKMRAYSLQSKGLDTIDADHNIGFLDDERDFNIAAKILKLLKVNKVNIITNNFTKVSSLKKAGIKIAKQINTKPTINKFNKNYFKTRVKKTGYGFKNLD